MSSTSDRDAVQPTSERELRDLIAPPGGSPKGPPIVATGLGSTLAWARPNLPADARRISTRSLLAEGSSGIVEYVPGDGTLTALAGARMSDLRDAVAEGGHELTPAIQSDSTLGGVLASGRSGPDRAAYGPVRHHVLGMRVLDGTGRFVRSGGRLVKNVTGFDLHRLHVGGRGTLGIVLEASMRLMPKAEVEVHAVSSSFASASAATEAGLKVRAETRIRPRALFARGTELHIVLAGRERQVDVERALVLDLVDIATWDSEPDAARRAYSSAPESASLRIATSPSRVIEVVRAIESSVGFGAAPNLYVEPGAAVIDVEGPALVGAEEAWCSDLLGRWDPATILTEPRFDLPATIARLCAERSVTPPAAARWTQRLVDAFDPHSRLRAPDFPALASS